MANTILAAASSSITRTPSMRGPKNISLARSWDQTKTGAIGLPGDTRRALQGVKDERCPDMVDRRGHDCRHSVSAQGVARGCMGMPGRCPVSLVPPIITSVGLESDW